MPDVELAAVSSGSASIGQSVYSWIYNPSTFIVYASMFLQPGVEQARSAVKVRVAWQNLYRYSANYSPWYTLYGIHATTGATAQLYRSGAGTASGFFDHTLDLTNYRAIYIYASAMIPGGYDSGIGASRSAYVLVTGDASVAVPEVGFIRYRDVAGSASAAAEVRALTYPGQYLFPGTLVREDTPEVLVVGNNVEPVQEFAEGHMRLPVARTVTLETGEFRLPQIRSMSLQSTFDGSPDLDG